VSRCSFVPDVAVAVASVRSAGRSGLGDPGTKCVIDRAAQGCSYDRDVSIQKFASRLAALLLFSFMMKNLELDHLFLDFYVHA
jgi:hypothetical protein